MAIVAFFIYLNRPGPCDSIFEQTAPTLGTSLHFLKTSGELVVGRDKIQDLTDGAQRLGILCKNCCIEQLSGRINAEQYKDCMETVKGFETQAAAVASSVSAVDTAKQHGQVQLVSEKTQQAELGAS
ncbi:MAG: hypothetical protein ACREQD_06255, partial [Candidatus Binataceae bacterium]